MAAESDGEPIGPVINLRGPTASGKTDIALALAASFPIEIISVDSAQVYRRMDIGTAKPGADELAICRHWLIDICEPWESFDAGQFVAAATAAIRDCWQRGKLPLLAGGTMLYFDALVRGLARMPEGDPVVRAAIDAEAARLGWPALHSRLAAIDAISAERIRPQDAQRIQRALEVFEITGTPISELQARTRPAIKAHFIDISLMVDDRTALAQRIEARFDAMMKRGFLDEVRALLDEPAVHPDLPAMRAVGYRQLGQFVLGDLDLESARSAALAATRQLAKRQMTWLRARERDIRIDAIDGDALDAVVEVVGTARNDARDAR